MSIHVTSYICIDQLPRECIEDCTAGGQDATGPVAHWREELDFTVDREAATSCLAGYGAWEREEMAEWDDDRLAETVLWLACGDFSEYITGCEDADTDPFGERPDDFFPACGSDIFTLE